MKVTSKFRYVAFALIFLLMGLEFLSAQETIEPQKMYEVRDAKTEVEIFANIPDVNVYLNGTYQGRTNLQVSNLTPGFYMLHLEKSGYEPVDFTIFVKNHYGQRFFIEMK